MTPPVTMQTWLSGSEVISELLVVLTLWGCSRWIESHRNRELFLVGTAAGMAAVVRPALVLIWVPCLALILLDRPRRAERRGEVNRLRSSAVLLLPVLVLAGGLSALSWSEVRRTRADTAAATWHLSTRTSEYVELLPASDRPAQSLPHPRSRNRTYTGSVDHPTAEGT